MLRLLGAAAAIAALCSTASAHDPYRGLYEGGAPTGGRLCCGGGATEAGGDCEGLVDGQFQILPNGDAIITTKRYGGASVYIEKSRIAWMTIPGDNGTYQGHWCGKPRAAWPGDKGIRDDDPDPQFTTFCIFLSPGGV